MDIMPLAGVFSLNRPRAVCPFILAMCAESRSVYVGSVLKDTGWKIQIQVETKQSWNKIKT